MSHLLQTKTTWDKWRWTGPYKRIINHIDQEKSQTGGRQKKMYNWWSRAYDDKINKNPQTIASLSLDNDKHMAKMMMLTICNID